MYENKQLLFEGWDEFICFHFMNDGSVFPILKYNINIKFSSLEN